MGKKTSVTVTEKTALVNINSPAALTNFAKDLKEFVVNQQLFTPIDTRGGVKNYVNVEGWQFAGASLGIYPVVQSVERVPAEGDEIKYRATIDLIRMVDGSRVGSAMAICSNRESKRKSADEFVIASMAQTRAVGKAFRLSIGWIMKLAGYEPLPAEEVADDQIVEAEPQALAIEDVKYLVNIKLASLSASQKMKLLKDYAGTINEKKIDDKGYLRLYKALTEPKVETN